MQSKEYTLEAEIFDSANIKWEGLRNAAADPMSRTIFTARFMESGDADETTRLKT